MPRARSSISGRRCAAQRQPRTTHSRRWTCSPKEELRLHKEIIEGEDATLIVVAIVADK
jgi:hypothetical protein